MFDFTKEVVINNGNQVAKVSGATGDKFRVHGGGDYHAKYVVDGRGYKTEAQDGALAVLTINASELVNAISNDQKHFTLNIELGLDRDARQDWATAVYLYKKPMMVDAFAANWGDAVEELSKLLKAVLTDYKFVHVLTADDADFAAELGVAAPAAGEVAIVGADYNVKVRKVSIIEYVCDARCEGASEEPMAVYAGRPEDAPAYIVYTPNVVEFGTYDYLLHNLRMPTYENYRFTSPAAVEMPMPGVKYTQYTFLYCVPRPGLGGLSVAGQFNHSTTTHVFFVAENAKEAFEQAFGDIEWKEVTPANGVIGNDDEKDNAHNIEILPDSFATSEE